MAHLSGIFVYPVKSLDAGSPASVDVLASGALADDRRFAIVDANGRFVNGKRHARVHALRSRFRDGKLDLSADGGRRRASFSTVADRAAIDAWLSAFFGFDASIRENDRRGFPDDNDSPGPTLISTGTLREIGRWFGLEVADVRARFRANLEIDGVPPFWEDQLYGPRGTAVRFRVGAVELDGINPSQRCVVPARDPLTGLAHDDFARRFVELRRRHLPAWAEASRFADHFYRVAVNTTLAGPPGRLRLGDAVTILGRRGAPTPPTVGSSRWSGALRVAAIVDEARDVRTFHLVDPAGNALPFEHAAGQALTVAVPIDGVRHRRTYTIASSPTRRDRCELTIKRDPLGIVSRYVHDRVAVGATLDCAGPIGAFTFAGDVSDGIALIAGGVGVTPLMSILRSLVDRAWPGRIDLIYCARASVDVIFSDELDAIVARHGNVRVTTTLTAEPEDRAPGRRGRITAAMIGELVPDVRGRRHFVCGPAQMAADVRAMLASLGVPADRVHHESFGGPRRPAASTAGTHAIRFAGHDDEPAPRAGTTVLDAADQAAFEIEHGCLAGVCGRCRVRLLSGTVDMPIADGLALADRDAGWILACQARPTTDVLIAAP